MNSISRKSLTLFACFVFALTLCVGCGGGGSQEQAAEKSAEAADSTVAVHDCAGPCGMKDVPEGQLTMVDGKWYCGGCVEKAKQDDHSGHDH